MNSGIYHCQFLFRVSNGMCSERVEKVSNSIVLLTNACKYQNEVKQQHKPTNRKQINIPLHCE